MRAFGALALSAGLFLAGCQRRVETRGDITVEHEIEPRPPRVGPARVTLRVADASGRPLGGARVRLEANMSHAGMRPVFADASELEPGRYQTELEFTMAGDWVVLVRLDLPDGRKIERQFDVKGVQSG
ncbi:MAG: FixH family protein [Pyrinomonadaceae bacterium]